MPAVRAFAIAARANEILITHSVQENSEVQTGENPPFALDANLRQSSS